MNPARLSFRRGDIPAVIVAVVLIVFFLYAYFKDRDWQRATGFGPEWQCTEPGRADSDFCIKKPSPDSPKQTKALN